MLGEPRLVTAIGAITDFKLLNLCLFDIDIYAGVSPELSTGIPSNSVIGLDHAIFHQRGEALEAIEKAGQIVGFLPPDSPDLNPIGKKWGPAKSIRPKFGYSPEELLSYSNFMMFYIDLAIPLRVTISLMC